MSVVQLHPVVHRVVVVSIIFHRGREQFPQEIVIWGLVEGEFADIVQVDGKLLRIAFDEFGDGCRLFLLSNLLVLLLVGRRLESLPRETATEEVEENVTKRLEIVPS